MTDSDRAARIHEPLTDQFLGVEFSVEDTAAYYAELRAKGPLLCNETRGFWVAPRHAESMIVSTDPQTFCSAQGILTFEIGELKLMEKGGRGLTLIDLEPKDTLAGACAYTRSVKIEGIGRGGKEREETLEIRSLNNAKAARGRKGKAADLGFKPNRITRVE